MLDLIKNFFSKYGAQYGVGGFNSEIVDNMNTIQKNKRYYQGCDPEFHDTVDSNGQKRRIKSLRMAKKIGEDNASLIINEQSEITSADDAVKKFLTGDAINQDAGFFGRVQFWQEINRLCEKIYGYAGAGFLVLSVDNIVINGDEMVDGDIKLNYLTAENSLPLSYEGTRVSEVAFFSQYTLRGVKYCHLEIHQKVSSDGDNEQYLVSHIFLDMAAWLKSKTIKVADIAIDAGYMPSFISPIRLFSQPWNTAINHPVLDELPFGTAAITDAIDQLQEVDIAFNNRFLDIKSSEKKIFIKEDYVATEIQSITASDGSKKKRVVAKGSDSVFTPIPAGVDDDKKIPDIMKEYNPDMRIDQNNNAVQNALNTLSFRAGLGQRFYNFVPETNTTAYAVRTSNYHLTYYVNKQRTNAISALEDILRQTIKLENILHDTKLSETAQLSFNFDDSELRDPELEKSNDLILVQNGIMAKWEYRVKYFGESEEDAKKKIEEIGASNPQMDLSSFFNPV